MEILNQVSGDFKVTDRIYEAANVIGIEFLDHIVIGDGTYESILGRDCGEI